MSALALTADVLYGQALIVKLGWLGITRILLTFELCNKFLEPDASKTVEKHNVGRFISEDI